jgi:hypothetical protein
VNAYVTPNLTQHQLAPIKQHLNLIMDQLPSYNTDTIVIAGDLNAIDSTWSTTTTSSTITSSTVTTNSTTIPNTDMAAPTSPTPHTNTNSNSAGKMIKQFCHHHQLVMFNTVYCPYIPTRHHSINTIDLVIGTTDSISSLSADTQSTLNLVSDHVPLSFSIVTATSTPNAATAPQAIYHQWNISSSTNFICFTDAVAAGIKDHASVLQEFQQTLLTPFNRNTIINEWWHLLNITLYDAAYQTIGVKRIPVAPKAGFNSEEVQQALQHLRTSRKLKHHHNNADTKQQYKDAKVAFSQALLHQKHQKFINDITSAHIATDAKKFWQIYNSTIKKAATTTSSSSQHCLHVNSSTNAAPNSPIQSLNHLATAFENTSSIDEQQFQSITGSINDEPALQRNTITKHYNRVTAFRNQLLVPLPDTMTPTVTPYNDTISLSELIKSIGALPRDTASGTDCIHPKLLKNSGIEFIKQLLLLFNKCWFSATTPDVWRHSRVQALHKGGATSNSGNYRPISITSTVARTYERIMYYRLLLIPSVSSSLSPCQSGFRRGRATSDNLVVLQAMIDHHLNNNLVRHVPVCYLDIQKAYDRASTSSIMYLLDNQYGVTGRMWCNIVNFITNRTFTVNFSVFQSDTHTINNGVPQGSVVAPLLFSLFINTLITKITKETPVVVLAFADDLVLIPDASLKTTIQMQRALQTALHITTEWANTHHVLFNTSKSNVVPFTKQKSFPKSCLYQLQNHHISTTKTYKYLGIMMHYKMDWRVHYSKLLHTAKCFSGAIRNIIRAGDTTINETKILTTSLLLSRITYSLPFIQLSAFQINKLQTLLIRPLAVSVQLPFSTHRHSILHEFGILPLPLQQQYTRATLLVRTLTHQHGDNPAQALLQHFYSNHATTTINSATTIQGSTATSNSTSSNTASNVTPDPDPPPAATISITINTTATNSLNFLTTAINVHDPQPPLPVQTVSLPPLIRSRFTNYFIKRMIDTKHTTIESLPLTSSIITSTSSLSVALLLPPFTKLPDNETRTKMLTSLKKAMFSHSTSLLNSDSTTTAYVKQLTTTRTSTNMKLNKYLKVSEKHIATTRIKFKTNRINSRQQLFQHHRIPQPHCLRCTDHTTITNAVSTPLPPETIEHILLQCDSLTSIRRHYSLMFLSVNVPFTTTNILDTTNSGISTHHHKFITAMSDQFLLSIIKLRHYQDNRMR